VNPSAILCADWAKEYPKRAVYVADVSARKVRRLEAGAWSLATLLDEGDRWARRGPVLATFDAPLGVPDTYLAAAASAQLPAPCGKNSVPDWGRITVWPFEGELDVLLKSAPVVLGEVYPRAAYATALIDAPTNARPRLSVAKTDPLVRRSAVQRIQSTKWVRELEVEIEDCDYAEANEDDFDACLTAAALLRCVLEKLPMTCPIDSPRVEGGILGTGSVNMALRERVLQGLIGQHRDSRTPKVQTDRYNSAKVIRSTSSNDALQ
jgi:hypothetical protein